MMHAILFTSPEGLEYAVTVDCATVTEQEWSSLIARAQLAIGSVDTIHLHDMTSHCSILGGNVTGTTLAELRELLLLPAACV